MAFNGTQHFPKQEITSFMQALGMRFGAHVNAHTSFDETEYDLQIPTGNPAVIDRSLTILEDFAHNVSFDGVEIDKERGVILEEWRLGLGAGERIVTRRCPCAEDSRYAEQSPIGPGSSATQLRSAKQFTSTGIARHDSGRGRRRLRQEGWRK
jgi:zinc protease